MDSLELSRDSCKLIYMITYKDIELPNASYDIHDMGLPNYHTFIVRRNPRQPYSCNRPSYCTKDTICTRQLCEERKWVEPVNVVILYNQRPEKLEKKPDILIENDEIVDVNLIEYVDMKKIKYQTNYYDSLYDTPEWKTWENNID